MSDMNPLCAIILAAGRSTRFGRPKQLIEYGGVTLLRRAVMAAKEAADSVIVVIGFDAPQMAAHLAGFDVTCVENGGWIAGPGSSITMGIEAAIGRRPDTAGVLITPCDQPFATGQVLRQLSEIARKETKGIVACEYADTVGIPALFGRDYFEALLSLPPEKGAKGLLTAYAGDVSRLPFPAGEYDIDTSADYERLLRFTEPNLTDSLQ